ncbi:Glycosyltransferase, catalytic subunit of cellulose synthase and poly-beta-1,6-N-acetylglucosamine synthase [Amycolatopsis arida]|uniref:Glycosyltransferase, catalytic subunit of cellulose synthase and poly-beta-1,6-N-acetylglucosamine synthase n=1 Tax=Amycolatopsis arida TaxID=587909 RepID=A0A1I5WZW0_9PSEU|nr:glycosyltransferase [Amycolatopsis arida]TDX92535.1 cellulose synthase/poly-beta-1,6-N-acetylglucosamine synthase-like glycosyltransferase [Amycolatopsis arida]SFQ25295.1 Glycosyltransferase, catalytic subunit of cellulose synthase and poly-beta-1,6-N-acetylglucosamine synthase [Amycolatopsis arida]
MSGESVKVLLAITQAFALTMSVAFIVYVVVIIVPFLRRKPGPVGDPRDFDWHFFVPCRDEETVIRDTVRYLRTTFPFAHVWVVDDDSEDRTARVVRSLWRRDGTPDPFIHLVQRKRPNARTGKGDALNQAYRTLVDWCGKHIPRDKAIVCVVDADGRPAPNCLEVCAADHLFGDGTIGAVQLDVWMHNRDVEPADGSWWKRKFGLKLAQLQDLEFRTAIAAIQTSRGYTGTISMGGNGQFTRLSALHSIGGPEGAPWRGSLLEDFELGVHLLTAGWRTGYTPDSHVSQEGLYSLRRFLTQRTRWGQGTMQCARYVRRIWDSPHLTTLGAAEMMYYLAQPWMQLFGSLLYPVPFVVLLVNTAGSPAEMWTWFTGGAWILFAIYGTFGLAPFVVWGPVYQKKCLGSNNLLRGLGMGLAYALYIYTFYITSWRALFRLIRGRNGWAKTRRNKERSAGAKVALDS